MARVEGRSRLERCRRFQFNGCIEWGVRVRQRDGRPEVAKTRVSVSPRPILFGGGLSFPIYNGRPLQSDENIVNGPANACIMVCEHLTGLEQELLRMGIREVHRGQPWSKNCREWVYFDCCFDLVALRAWLLEEADERDITRNA